MQGRNAPSPLPGVAGRWLLQPPFTSYKIATSYTGTHQTSVASWRKRLPPQAPAPERGSMVATRRSGSRQDGGGPDTEAMPAQPPATSSSQQQQPTPARAVGRAAKAASAQPQAATASPAPAAARPQPPQRAGEVSLAVAVALVLGLRLCGLPLGVTAPHHPANCLPALIS